MEYQEEANIRNIENQALPAARARTSVAENLQQFGKFGIQRYESTMRQRATEEAGSADITLGEDPATKSPTTVVGRVYNDVVTQAYSGQLRNDYSQKMSQLYTENPLDPQGFTEKADAYVQATLNETPPALKNFAAVDMQAKRNQYLEDIMKAHAKNTVTESIAITELALDGIMTDAMSDIRRGDDSTFLPRREAYIAAIDQNPYMTQSQKIARLKSFDQSADGYYHIGEVERLIKNGDYKAAIKYKRDLAQGKFKSFGEFEADRDTVMENLDAQINNYFVRDGQLEDQEYQQMQRNHTANLNGLAAKMVTGQANMIDASNMLARGQIDLQGYKSLKALTESAQSGIKTDPQYYFEWQLNAPGSDPEFLRSSISSAVERGWIGAEDGARELGRINDGTYDLLSQSAPKRELDWLRKSMGMDNDLVDMTDAKQAVMAESYRIAQDLILDGEEPRQAVAMGFANFRDNQSEEIILRNQYVIPIKHTQDAEMARRKVSEAFRDKEIDSQTMASLLEEIDKIERARVSGDRFNGE